MGRIEGGSDEKRSFFRKKGCRFCTDRELTIDFKNKILLRPYVTERFKIVPRRISGTCALHQRQLTLAIKRARHIGVLPYTSAQVWRS